MIALEVYTREIHVYIDNFETQMRSRLYEVQELNLSNICKEISTLCTEVRLLSESHILVFPLVIPDLMQPLSQAPKIVFDLICKNMRQTQLLGPREVVRRSYGTRLWIIIRS